MTDLPIKFAGLAAAAHIQIQVTGRLLGSRVGGPPQGAKRLVGEQGLRIYQQGFTGKVHARARARKFSRIFQMSDRRGERGEVLIRNF